jgi:hypothetical protein
LASCRFSFQRDANLLSADRVDVVIEFQHVILLHSAQNGSAAAISKVDILYRMIYNVNFRVMHE